MVKQMPYLRNDIQTQEYLSPGNDHLTVNWKKTLISFVFNISASNFKVYFLKINESCPTLSIYIKPSSYIGERKLAFGIDPVAFDETRREIITWPALRFPLHSFFT